MNSPNKIDYSQFQEKTWENSCTPKTGTGARFYSDKTDPMEFPKSHRSQSCLVSLFFF